jgi:hypothetical protein
VTTAIRMIASNDPLPWSGANPKSLSMKSMRQPDLKIHLLSQVTTIAVVAPH